MSDKKKKKPQKLRARLPRGFVDRSPEDIRATDEMVSKIREVFERYGFDPVETPMFEYTDCLGKFLPDSDRPNEGVFSVADDDDQWMSLRYDLTAPLARHVAENINEIQLPYRTYRNGWVFRNEKPGPGRFRQFMQFDADTVGAPGVQADAEMAMMMADTMEALGIPRGDYVIRVNNRKYLDGVMDLAEVPIEKRLDVMRALDKKDRIGAKGVERLLTTGRFELENGTGDFTEGLGLNEDQVQIISNLVTFVGEEIEDANSLSPKEREAHAKKTNLEGNAEFLGEAIKEGYLEQFSKEEVEKIHPDYLFSGQINGRKLYFRRDNQIIIKRIRHAARKYQINNNLQDALDDFERLVNILDSTKYGPKRIKIDPSCVRRLEYYTGPVFEAELTFPVTNEKGQEVVFGSVGGGGRYDGLVKRFTGQDVPATGFSIGVSRLMTALKNLKKLGASQTLAPVLVTVMDKDVGALGNYQKLVQDLRQAGIRAEMWQGNANAKLGKQLQYADRRDVPIAIIQGTDEREKGIVQIKDMIEGRKQAAAIGSNEEWRETRPGQFEVPQSDIVAEVQKRLAEQKADVDKANGDG